VGADKSVEYADQEMAHMLELTKYLPEYLPDDYKKSFMNIIRLSLIEAYRKGWNDSEKYFDESK